MCPGPPYDTAKRQPRLFSPRDFKSKKLNPIGPNGEPQKSVTESVLRPSNSSTHLCGQTALLDPHQLVIKTTLDLAAATLSNSSTFTHTDSR